MDLSAYLSKDRIVKLRSTDKEEALRELVKTICTSADIFEKDKLYEGIKNREQLLNTKIGPKTAIPHTQFKIKDDFIIAVGVSRKGVEYSVADKQKVNLIVMIIIGDSAINAYVEILAAIATVLKDEKNVEAIISAKDPEEVLDIFSGREAPALPTEKEGFPTIVTDTIMVRAAEMAKRFNASALFVYVESEDEMQSIERLQENINVIVVASDAAGFPEDKEHPFDVIRVPVLSSSRMIHMRLAVLFALYRKKIQEDDVVVWVTGVPGSKGSDTITVIDVAKEYSAFYGQYSTIFLKERQPEVLERVITLACKIAREGREGKPIGTIFVVGDSTGVQLYCKQLVLNPFSGFLPEERNILDVSLEETIKEFSSIDGAFIIREDGTILSCGTYLRTVVTVPGLPQGLGARHEAAAAITMVTDCVSVAISESTGTVTVFKNGKIAMTVEKTVSGQFFENT